jgi:hypothetical protein
MPNFYFEREARTPYSECYTIVEDDVGVGRVDIHFAESVIHATVNVAESLTTESIQELIDTIDQELLDSVGIVKDEMIVHVHQGRDLGVFSGPKYEENGGGRPHMA